MISLGYALISIANGLLIWTAMLLLLSTLFRWLWNITITRIFEIREITYWEALRLMAMAALLFGNGPGFNLKF
ncbi:MAG: hypothetical protein KGZ33_07205 [Alkaliphilus sp.]|nr:hypothetical protein [Alkaliphilus sp.]